VALVGGVYGLGYDFLDGSIPTPSELTAHLPRSVWPAAGALWAVVRHQAGGVNRAGFAGGSNS
jgi:hypothetical protein